MNTFIRWAFFLVGLIVFALGISITIHVQHLGIHPWDVLNVGLYQQFGLSVGTWNILCGCLLIIVSALLDKNYIKLGTFINAVLIGIFVDLFLWLQVFPKVTYSWFDLLIIAVGIILMGLGGGLYNAAGVGSGPRDGFMLAISDKTGASIRKVRIITESSVLLLGLLLGGPVFLVTFVFTFIQSPIFQYSFLTFKRMIDRWTCSEKIQLPSQQKRHI